MYRAESGRGKDPRELRNRQDQGWNDVVKDFEADLGLILRVADGVIYREQDKEASYVIRKWLEGLTEDMLLVVFTATAKCGSLVLGHAVFNGMEADKVWDKYIVEEKFLIEKTIEDEEQNKRLEEIRVELGHVLTYRKLIL